MTSKKLKALLGDLIQECTDENFKLGHNPIVDLIDNLELDGMESDCGKKDWETEERQAWNLSLLEELTHLKPEDPRYEQVFFIDYYSNGFYYCTKDDEAFWEEWKTWDKTIFKSRELRFWYYYFLNRKIMDRLFEEEMRFRDGEFELTPEGSHPFIDEFVDMNENEF